MSRCFTLDHTGMRCGIATTAASWQSNPQRYIDVGGFYEYSCTGEERTLIRRWRRALFDRRRPPMVGANGLLLEASLARRGRATYLLEPKQDDRGVLVFIDTAHTEPSEDGGYWNVLSGNPQEIVRGREGYEIYSLRPRDGLFVEAGERCDTHACYDRGLILMLPGSRLEVVFHAPGSLAGVLTYNRRSGLQFRMTRNHVDPVYVYEPVDYQAERDLEDMLGPLSLGYGGPENYDDYDL